MLERFFKSAAGFIYMLITPTGMERTFGEDEFIVSKTDSRGIITYANDVFLRLAGYSEKEIIGKPHNIIRHPDMPRCVFKLLWDTLKNKKEIFAYVVNLAKNGDHYWVFAHVTPTFDEAGNIVGYHSNRRVPKKESVEFMAGLYKTLRDKELENSDPNKGMEEAFNMLVGILEEKGMSYDEFIFAV